MYFLTPLCFICLKSKSDLTVMNMGMLTELIYCIDKTEDFISPISNHTKICKDCLNELSRAFQFKKMCLKNIGRFKVYVDQLKQPCDSSKVVKKLEQYLNNLLVKIEIPFQSSDDSKFPKQCANDEPELLLHKEEILDDVHYELLDNQPDELLTQEPECNENLDQLYICAKCDKHFPDKQQLIEHVQNSSNDTKLSKQCADDEFQVLLNKENILENQPDELLRPESGRNEIMDQIFICAICDKNYPKKQQLIQHVRSHLNKKLFSCDECIKKFKTSPGLKYHKLLFHSGQPLFSCLICGKSFPLESRLNRHNLTHSDKRPHSCPTCKKSFKCVRTLKRHQLLHAKVKPYSCAICMKSFILKSIMESHMVVHTNERPHSCSICKKSYRYKRNLNHHKLTHLTKRPYFCSICKKNFKSSWTLKQHEFIHANVKPYSCSICMRGFSYRSTMKAHMAAVHTNEQPNSCPICQKSFVYKANLYAHRLTHSDKRPHSCTICKKSFKMVYNLKQHELIHANVKPYSCSICKKSFVRKNRLVRHKSTHFQVDLLKLRQ